MIDGRWVLLLAVATGAAGCATAIRGTTQIVSIASDPPGAQCTLSRDRMEVAAVAATPDRVTIARGASDLVVHCRREGYHDGRTLLIAGDREPMFVESVRDEAAARDARSAGVQEAAAVAAGGAAVAGTAAGTTALIGAGIAGSTVAAGALLVAAPVVLVAAPISIVADASSGTYYAYPRSAVVTLLPQAFADAQARAAAIARVSAALDRDDEELRRRFDDSCGLSCKRAKPAFDAFLMERRAEFMRRVTRP